MEGYGGASTLNGMYFAKIVQDTLPSLAAVYFFGAYFITIVFPPGSEKNSARPSRRSNVVIGFLISTVFLTYIADSINLLSSTFEGDGVVFPKGRILFELSSGLLWFTTILLYSDKLPQPVSYPFYGQWIIYLVSEIFLLLCPGVIYARANIISILCQTLRVITLSLLICAAFGPRVLPGKNTKLDEENSPLLAHEQPLVADPGVTGARVNGAAYGSCDSDTSNNQSSKDKPKDLKANVDVGDGEDNEKKGGIWSSMKDLRELAPFFWPSGRPRLQLLFGGMILCLIAERAVNLLIPIQLGLITDILSKPQGGRLPWEQILIFAALRLLDSSGGLPALRRFMCMPVDDFSYLKLSTTAFNHVMSLSCDFHDNKHSGRLWTAVIRGQSVKDVIHSILFLVAPMIIDLVLAVGVLYYVFDGYMALDVATVMVLFLWSSSKLVAKQKDKRREWNEARGAEFTALCESTENWRTVSYFSRVPYEISRYLSLVQAQLKARFKFRFWDHMENASQSALLICGLTAACFMAAYHVSTGEKPIGSFVMLLSYWAQLSSPLQFIANGFGEMARDLVDVEEFLSILRQQPTVQNAPDANPLKFESGNIKFTDVNFSYDGKRGVLRNINFQAKAGGTTALVGQTGGGKSTILKLIFRFYDPTQGMVEIDGQDVSGVSLETLREGIGVVPQDPTLFNASIMNNLRYGKLDATDEEVMEACKAVALHDRFMSLTDGYDTLVGERGMRLSGGELQRVAIAQAILKNPRIVLLDEATSSVDSETEAVVQESLKKLTAGRTTLVIAHRLSTIVNADRIVVINNGEIVEQGTHAELLQNHGYYHRLCFRQGFLEASESDSGTPFSETTCSCHQYPSNGERSWKPDAPEFIPKTYKAPGVNQPQFPLSDCDQNRLRPEDKGFSESTVDIYETETDDSFHIETGPEKENLQVKFATGRTTNTNGCDQTLKDNIRRSHDEAKLFYPTTNQNARGNSLGFDEGYDATAAEGTAVSKRDAQDNFRRGLSKSEPSNLARESSMDEDEDSGDWQTVGTKATNTLCPNKAQSRSSARPRRPRRRNRKGIESYQRTGVQP
ncbi:heavy metal tolerance protein [Nannizzia gypsea CBS 118893]|uniref:Heavy metal tolerance protein n=1 Tax=Arthroderma gypseum (strain ATCC MYA-4604 / CBS 118893) TaxID=535722 RepID=E5QZP1_ARTGP|nr:heavy metal tolerance protein [Nannizzia gypsea CBS 118893]EFQ98192.1 heavy metal tolerance protein [Nannizzia gypsea CBS 118893]